MKQHLKRCQITSPQVIWITINDGCLSNNFLGDCECIFLTRCLSANQKLEILYQNSVSAVSAPDLMQRQQGELWLAFAPRGLPDWLGCCYLMEHGGAPFSRTSKVAFNCFHSKLPWQLAPSPGKVSNPAVPWWQTLPCAVLPLHPPQYCQFDDLFEQQSSSTHKKILLRTPHSRWQHLHPGSTKEVLPLHFITYICHRLPLCSRSIPFGGLTGVNTVPASCGDWWLRGSNVQVPPCSQSYINCFITSQHLLVTFMVHKVSITLYGLLCIWSWIIEF